MRKDHSIQRFYTGIGSRQAPAWAQSLATEIAAKLSTTHVLRHGDASGMDEAFSQGSAGREEIWAPWKGFRKDERSSTTRQRIQSPAQQIESGNMLIREGICPHFFNMKPSIQALFARNVFQITGQRSEMGECDPLSDFVVYWAPERSDGTIEGGTRIAVYLARRMGIPTINLDNVTQSLPLLDELGIVHPHADEWVHYEYKFA